MYHYWTLLTKKSHIDRDNNSLIIGETIEEFQVNLPTQLKEQFAKDVAQDKAVALPLDFEVVSYLGPSTPDESAKILVEMELPNNHKVKIAEQTIKFEGEKRMRNRIKCNAMAVSGSGINTIRVIDATENTHKTMIEMPITISVAYK